MEKEVIEIKKRLKNIENVVFAKNINADSFVAPVAVKPALDFSLNERAFIKKYSPGLNGKDFFVLILAYLVEGQKNESMQLSQIKDIWKSCIGVIGFPYASIFATRAKESGWIEALKNKKGLYRLSKYWREAFKQDEQNS